MARMTSYTVKEISPNLFKVFIMLDDGAFEEYVSHDIYEILTYAEMLNLGVFFPQTTFDDDCSGKEDTEDIAKSIPIIFKQREEDE